MLLGRRGHLCWEGEGVVRGVLGSNPLGDQDLGGERFKHFEFDIAKRAAAVRRALFAS